MEFIFYHTRQWGPPADPVIHCDLGKKVSMGGEKLEMRAHTILLKKLEGDMGSRSFCFCFFFGKMGANAAALQTGMT